MMLSICIVTREMFGARFRPTNGLQSQAPNAESSKHKPKTWRLSENEVPGTAVTWKQSVTKAASAARTRGSRSR